MRFRHIAIVLALMAALAGVLFAMGRVPICTCGYVKLWHGARFSSENSQHLFDWWSLSHVVHGFIFYGVLRLALGRPFPAARFIAAVCIEGGWEIFENTNFIIERYRNAGVVDYFGDSIVNSLGDVVAMMLGYAFAMRLTVKTSLVAVAALELSALVAIRDNLTLNIVMLIYPFETIQTWQEGG